MKTAVRKQANASDGAPMVIHQHAVVCLRTSQLVCWTYVIMCLVLAPFDGRTAGFDAMSVLASAGKGKPLPAIVERVQNGSTVQVLSRMWQRRASVKRRHQMGPKSRMEGVVCIIVKILLMM